MEHDEAVSAVSQVGVTIAKNAVPGFGPVSELLAAGLDAFIGTGTKRLNDAIRVEILEAVFEALPAVEQRVAALEVAGVRVNAADVGRVCEHFANACRTAADAKKRKLLENAFVRSFDRELYESGLLNALWERLERLSYGDLFLLREIVEAGEHGVRSVYDKYKTQQKKSLGHFHAMNLIREGLCWTLEGSASPADARPAELGEKLCALAILGLDEKA